jgi:O-antigen ligase
LFSCFPSHESGIWQRVIAGGAGLLGLFLAKSVGSIFGIAIALVVGVLWISARGKRWRGLTALGLAACLALTAVAAVQLLRPESLPTSAKFTESSTYHRVILGTAGLEVFRADPLIGVGWRRSSSPQVIGSTEITVPLRSRFETGPSDFFPDVGPGSVHNAYIQILAELGIVGFALFVTAMVKVGLDVRALLARCVAQLDAWRAIRFFALGIILVAVWWNDNPIYGGQTETIIFAVFLGCIGALARLQPPPAPETLDRADLEHPPGRL